MTRKPSFRPHSVELTIQSIGARGDGLARYQDEAVFVPFTVAGDHVAARLEGRRGDGLAARLIDVLQPGPDRVAPPCRHFGQCGGCSLQQLASPALAEWKRERLVSALRRVGVPADRVRPLIAIAPGSRRRASFAFMRRKATVLLGFNQRASHDLVEVDDCLLLAPKLLTLLAPLRDLLAACLENGDSGDLLLTLSDSGIDLVIRCDRALDLFRRETLAAFAEAHDLACLSWQQNGTAEPVAQRRPAQIRMGGVAVGLPPGGFLQPSLEGEAALVALVMAAITPKGAVADLYCGSGSFTLPLAQAGHSVHAVEAEESALKALATAARSANLAITCERRDLAQRPLFGAELAKFAAVLFDPPRAGAAAQAEALAGSAVQTIVAVSCNPATLARDAGLLMAGGYRLDWATPVDQFPWSAHLEAVACFTRQ